MPVVLDRRLEGVEDYSWLAPDGDENLARVARAVEEREEIASELHFSRIKAYKDGGMVGELSSGLPQEEVVFPRKPEHFAKKMLLKNCSSLPDFVDKDYLKGGPMVSRRMQAVIERHEAPGAGFQFHPVTVVLPDGSVFSEDYVFWDVFRRVDAIDSAGKVGTIVHKQDLSLGNHSWGRVSDHSKQAIEEGPQKRWVFKSVVGDAAVWSGFRYGSHLGMPIWVSDPLWADLKAAELTGFDPGSTWGEI